MSRLLCHARDGYPAGYPNGYPDRASTERCDASLRKLGVQGLEQRFFVFGEVYEGQKLQGFEVFYHGS